MFVIAEIGQAHDGSLGILHSYIDAMANTGVDAVKFQVHIAEAESSVHEPFRVKFSYEDKTRFDYWQRMSFNENQWAEIKEHCEAVGLEFLASPFSQAAVQLLEELNVIRYKIGSGEVTNTLMLASIVRTGKPIIISSGMSSFKELDQAIQLIQASGNDLAVLQCTTSYPTPPEKIGLNVINELKKRYPDAQVGLSEHSGTIYAGLAAAALGADVLEFHVVFDKRMFGPDATSSLTIDEAKTLVDGIRFIETSLTNPMDKTSSEEFNELKGMFEKSLAVNKSLTKGHVLTFDDLESKKPKGFGIDASLYKTVIGKVLTRDMNAFDFLNEQDLEG